MDNLDGKRLAAEHVNDSERPELLPTIQLIMDEVQAPRFIGILRRAPCFAMHHHLATPWALRSKSQAFFAV
jgi:hypothetical protein